MKGMCEHALPQGVCVLCAGKDKGPGPAIALPCMNQQCVLERENLRKAIFFLESLMVREGWNTVTLLMKDIWEGKGRMGLKVTEGLAKYEEDKAQPAVRLELVPLESPMEDDDDLPDDKEDEGAEG
jgi:hypothetical protein